LRVEADRGVLANYYRQKGTGRIYCHLVNLLEKPVFNPVLHLALPAGRKVSAVRVISPDGADFERNRWQSSSEHLQVELDWLDIYSVVNVSLKPKEDND